MLYSDKLEIMVLIPRWCLQHWFGFTL